MCIIMFGWGEQTIKEIAVDKDQHKCENCNNKVVYHLIRIRTWFELFFIPIIPYSTQYWLSCPVCQMGYKLTKDQVNEMIGE